MSKYNLKITIQAADIAHSAYCAKCDNVALVLMNKYPDLDISVSYMDGFVCKINGSIYGVYDFFINGLNADSF